MSMIFAYVIAALYFVAIVYAFFLLVRIDRNLTIQTELLSKIGRQLENNNRQD